MYCSNQPNIHARVVQFKSEHETFETFLKVAGRNPQCRKLDIESFLITPLQRLCKYPLLFREMIKCTEEGSATFTKLSSAMESIGEIVTQVNERVRKTENLNKLITVSKSIDFAPSCRFDLLGNHLRVFLLENEILFDGADAFGYLFHDILLISREMKTGEFNVNKVIYLNGCTLSDPDAPAKDLEPSNKSALPPPPAPEGFPFFVELHEPGMPFPYLIAFNNKFRKKAWSKSLAGALREAPPPPEGARQSPSSRRSSLRSPFNRSTSSTSMKGDRKRSSSLLKKRSSTANRSELIEQPTAAPSKSPVMSSLRRKSLSRSEEELTVLKASVEKYKSKYKEERRLRNAAENALVARNRSEPPPNPFPSSPSDPTSSELAQRIRLLEEENAKLQKLCATHGFFLA